MVHCDPLLHLFHLQPSHYLATQLSVCTKRESEGETAFCGSLATWELHEHISYDLLGGTEKLAQLSQQVLVLEVLPPQPAVHICVQSWVDLTIILRLQCGRNVLVEQTPPLVNALGARTGT